MSKLLSGYLPALKPDMIAALIPILRTEIPATPAISDKAYQVAAGFHKTSGLFPNPPSYSSIIDSSLISAAISKAGT